MFKAFKMYKTKQKLYFSEFVSVFFSKPKCEIERKFPYAIICNFVFYHSNTCGVYYPCDKPLFFQTIDALSNTSGQNHV